MKSYTLTPSYERMQAHLEHSLLHLLQRYLMEHGGLLPDSVNLAGMERVLDVACGSGQWVLDLAHAFPTLHVVGLDRHPETIRYARARAQTQWLHNAHFVEGDLHAMTALADESFDLVHARFLAPAVAPHAWSGVLRELSRVCRPGGHLVWMEAQFPASTSEACQQWCELLRGALLQAGATPAIIESMEILLSEADYAQVHKSTTCLDFSTDTPSYHKLATDAPFLLGLVQPWLTQHTVASVAEIDRVCQEALIDLYDEGFCATWTLLTLLGQKL